MKTLGIIFGGKSQEHNVSITSGLSVVKNINKEKYNVKQIYIDENGNWYEHKNFIEPQEVGTEKAQIEKNIEKIENIYEFLKNIDLIFPVLHGQNGEDGTIQGMLEIFGKKYIGCKVLASSIGMDKAYAKIMFEKAKLKQAKYILIKEKNEKYIYVDKEFNEKICSIFEILEEITKELKFPVFVKPSNSGSSIGINKAHNKEELKQYIEIAKQYDKKIVVEEGIKGRELECAVLEKEEIIASGVGEILPVEEFYSYNAKYKGNKTKTITNADIPKEIKEEIRKMAIKAFKAIDGRGLARVDFFWNSENNEVYINEINTMPGFTQISMYSKLWEAEGIVYSDLIDSLIELEK